MNQNLIDYRKIYEDILNSKNPHANLDALKDGACDDDREAQYYLALYFTKVEHNYKSFAYWIENAADKNHFEAMKLACKIFRYKPEKLKKVLRWTNQLAEMNDASSYRNLSEFYSKGLLVKIDEQKAGEFMEKAAALGDEKAIRALGGIEGKHGVIEVKDPKDRVSEKYIERIKKEARKGNLELGINLIRRAATGDARAHYMVIDKKMGHALDEAFQLLFWKQTPDEKLLDYIKKVYPRYYTILEIVEHIKTDGGRGDYAADVSKLTDIRCTAGFELLELLAKLGSLEAKVALVRIHYQNTHTKKLHMHISDFEVNPYKSAEEYALLAIYYNVTLKNENLAYKYMVEGFEKYGSTMTDFLMKFVKKGLPPVKKYVNQVFASDILLIEAA